MRLRLALAGVLVALPAAATVVIAQTLEEMSRSAPLVVRARVGQVQSMWNESHTTIETWAEVQVSEALKGPTAPGKTLMIRNPGGIVGPLGAYVSGSPHFEPGEDTLLFLEPARDTNGVWLVYAMAAGKVTFTPNMFGQVHGIRDLRGVALYAGGKTALKVLDKPEDLGTSDALLARIRAAVAR
jgi:hypothetical protein